MNMVPFIDLIKSALIIVICWYGSWDILTEVIRTFIPLGIVLILLLIIAGYFLRIPAPPPEAVEAIIGKPLDEATDPNAYVLRTVAHRGAGLDAPENTLEAFQMCNDKGCDFIEFDIALTSDDIPIVFHDATLERMTNLDLIIANQKWADLSGIDISVKHPFRDRFTKTNIPTLEQTVTQLLAAGQRMFIDIKENNLKMVKVINHLYEQHPQLYTRAIVTSFYPNIIYLIRRNDPKIVCSISARPHGFAYGSFNYPEGKLSRRSDVWYKHYLLILCDLIHEWALPRITYYLLGLSVVLLHKDIIHGKMLLEWRQKGVRVMAWTVNTPTDKQFFARTLKIPYLTDTLTGEATTHSASLDSTFAI